MRLKVIKRDGRLDDFRPERIISAIYSAERAMNRKENNAVKYAADVFDDIIKGYSDVEVVSVEEIQSAILCYLARHDPELGAVYEKYRNERSVIRERKWNIYRQFGRILSADPSGVDLMRENANVRGGAPMGRMLRIGSEASKYYYLSNPDIIPKDTANLHRLGVIHIHDLDFYGTSINCLQIPLSDILKRGFSTGHGSVRQPKGIRTAAALACIVLQSNQNDMFGGQSIPDFEYALAPYVDATYKHYVEMLKYLGFTGSVEAEAWKLTSQETYQAMEALLHNLNTMASRAGAQVPFSSINYGTGTTKEQRLVIRSILLATEAGLGHGETPIFPVQVFKVKDGVNYNYGDPNHDLFELSVKVSAKRLFPNWEFLDAPFNLQYYKAGVPDTEVATMGCYDGNQVVTFRVGGRLFVEGAERFFDKMAMFHEVRGCMKTDWINVEGKGVEVYDSNANGFVGVKKLIRNPAPDDARLVKFDHGRSIVLTPDHMLPVEGKGRTAVRDLAVGDQVEGVWTQYSEVTQSIDHDMAWLLGLLLCDGCYATSVAVSLGLDEADVRDKVLRVSKNNGWENRVKEYDRGPKGRYMDVHITTGSFKAIAKKLSFLFGGERKADRCIPSDVFCWPKEAKYAFLAGMMDADGCVRIHNEKTWYLNLGSVNEELAIQQMLLFQSLGVKAKIVRNHYKNVNAGAIRFTVYVNSTPELTQGLLRHMACKKKTDRMVNYEPMQDRTPFHLCTVESISKHRMSGWCYDIETESDRFDVSGIRSHNCRTRVMADRFGEDITPGRGNLSFTSINLPHIAIVNRGKGIKAFMAALDSVVDAVVSQLVSRYRIQANLRVKNLPFLMGQGLYEDSKDLDPDDRIEKAIRHGTLGIGFVGLAEALVALTGHHHGETDEAEQLGLDIVRHLRLRADLACEKYDLNFSLIGSPAESTAGAFLRADRKEFGLIPGVTDKEYYTNSHHIPVKFPISAYRKIKLEAPFHELENGGHITYVELDGDTAKNPEAVMSVVKCMHDSGIGYGAVNHPVDRDPVCGYTGVIGDTCPLCGRHDGEAVSEEKLRQIKKNIL